MSVWRYALVVVLCPVLLLAAMIGFASTWLRLGLMLSGIEDVTFQSLDIGLSRTEIRELEIGGPADQTVSRIDVDYTVTSLLAGRVTRITVAGLDITLNLDDLTAKDGAAEEGQSPPFIPAGAFLDELILEESRINLETPAGMVTIPLSGHVMNRGDQVLFELVADRAMLGRSDHGLQADLAIEGAFLLEEGPILDRLEARGKVSFLAIDAEIPGGLEEIDGEGVITINFEGGRLDAAIDGLNMTIGRLPFDPGPIKAPWMAALNADQRPVHVTGTRSGDGWRMIVAAPLDLTAAPGTVRADLDLQMALDDQGGFRSWDKGVLALDTSDLAWDDGRLAAGEAILTIEGPGQAVQGDLAITLDGLQWSNSAYTIEDAGLQQELALRFDGQILELSVAEQGRISLGRAAVIDKVESGWFTARLDPSKTPFLSLDISEGRWRHHLAASIDPVRLETAAGQWWARIEDLGFAASGGQGGLESGQLFVRQGRADRPGSNLALIGIESEVQLAEDGLAPDQIASLVIRAIRPLDQPRWFAPLRLDATLSPLPARLDLQGQLTAGPRPGVRMNFSGFHQPDTGEGALDFELAKLTFDPAGLQPGDLAPALLDVVEETSGGLGLHGKVAWQDGKLSSTADLLIEELGLTIGPARLERLNTLLHFDNLAPLTMGPGQELAIGRLEVGLPLTDGLVSMQLDADGTLGVDQLTWRFADGEVRARPFIFGSDVQDLTMVLDVDQLDLNGLLGLTELDGLSGEGVIDGVLPLSINEAGAVIEGGRLEATGKGVLRYRPEEAPGALQAGGASIGLMLQALENFRYDELNITLDGRTDGNTDIGLHLKGANPDLYDGHPVEFNLNLEGDLGTIIQTNLSNYRIPDRIRERLQGFGQ